MPLNTRCAHCGTVFRVTADQLQKRGGRVRCGKCLQVFDGLSGLAPVTTSPPAEVTGVSSSPAARTEERPRIVAAEAVGAKVPESTVVETAVAEPRTVEAAVDESNVVDTNAFEIHPVGDGTPAMEAAEAAIPALETQREHSQPDTQSRPMHEPATVLEAEILSERTTSTHAPNLAPYTDADNPLIQPAAETTVAKRHPLLAVVPLVLVLVLSAQAVYFYRSEIAAYYPPARPWLNEACAALNCGVPLPQRPQAVVIEASDLQMEDPGKPERIILTATLRNHARHDVGYPALDLVLTNANDHTLARRVFLPAEYLEKSRDVRTGFAASAELTVRLALDTGNLGASGFRLAVLEAPVSGVH